jgi:peptide deformylase
LIYKIVKYGNAVLETPAQPVTEFNEELKKLVAAMFESMYAMHGVGLAAPQIGIPRSLAVIDITSGEDPNAKVVLCNPTILKTEGKQTLEEGCLSLPTFRAQVRRPRSVTVRAQDITGRWFEKTAEDLLARAFLHETDHLSGRLFIAHLSALRRDLIKRKVRKLMKEGEW